MTIGVILVRCDSCGQLSYDWRNDRCIEENS